MFSSGYLICNDAIGDIADKIIRLICEEEIRHQYGYNGYTLIHRNFTIEKMSGEFIEVYKSML